MNPVHKGLCPDKIEYRWSLARAVLLDEKGAIEQLIGRAKDEEDLHGGKGGG
jgi:hypothetical protein